MDLKNSNYKVITNEGAKCGFCNKNLKPIGLDYLYVNYDKNIIEYERCNCEKAIQFWKEFDLEQEEKQRQEKNRKIINNIYKDNYMKKRLQKYNFENFSDTYKEKNVINQLIKFTDLCIKSEMKNGLIIYGNIGYEKTYFGACIANKIIEQNKIVLMEKSSSIISISDSPSLLNDALILSIIELLFSINAILFCSIILLAIQAPKYVFS